jgi:hypothetical protein
MSLISDNELLRRKLWMKVCIARTGHADRCEQADYALKNYDQRFTYNDLAVAKNQLEAAKRP